MKLYPFSLQKHAHDVDFARNRAKNIKSDIESGELKATDAEYDDVCIKIDKLTDLLLAVTDSRDGRVAWITGEQMGLAKEMIAWADCERAARMHG